MNKVTLFGNLGSDVELIHLESGNTIGKVSLATNSSYTNKQTGEKVQETEWHNLVLFGKSAENLAKYTKKGNSLLLEGKIKYRNYQDQDGNKKYITEIQVLNFTFVDQKKANETTVHGAETVKPPPPFNPNADAKEEDHDGLPF